MASISEKFQELGQKRDQNGLELHMNSLDENELQSFIKQKIHCANFTEIWDYILKSFRDTSRCHEKRLSLVLYVLKEIEDKDLPPSRINAVVNRLNLDLTKFKSEHLAKLCNFCLECIQSKKTGKMGWKDLMPELLNVLVERGIFTYEELDYTGQEYKTSLINTMCMSSWSPNVVTTLTAVFSDMPLNKEEHLKVVNKLGTYLDKLTPQEIPPFIYQLLRLCKQQNGRSMFLRLQNYFGLRIYSSSKTDEDSPDQTVDLDAIESTSNQDTIDAESTVLYHIHSAAALGYECIKDYLNSLKNMLKAPEFVLHPFQLMTLFTISTIPHYEETVFEIVRPCIVRSYHEEQKRVHSCWFREMVPTGPKTEEVFSKVIQFSLECYNGQIMELNYFCKFLLEYNEGLKDIATVSFKKEEFFYTTLITLLKLSGLESETNIFPACYLARSNELVLLRGKCIQDRDLVLSALVKFAFVLLGVGSALGRDIMAEKQWNLGNMILLKIIKRKRLIALTILQTLSNHIVIRQTVSQYIECLYVLGKTLPLLILENQSCVVELVDCLVQVPAPVANQLLDALIPLTKVSPTIRDHLIILLRKALYSRSVDTRQMAVNGFLKLITHLKISNLVSLSQGNLSSGSFASGHSLFTQISLNKSSQTMGVSGFSNEALCLEVLSILKRCFMQQMEVRMQLYEGLYDAVCMNPELGIPVLDVIWFHFSEYYIMDEEQLPPLKFDKIAVLREAQTILQEPLGKLVFTIGLIVTKVLESEEDRENNTVVKFVNILETICQRMPNCELVHFELDDGTDLLDIMPESQKKMLILKEAMAVYEALIGYKLFSWNENSENHGKLINSLYQGYTRLLQFSKTLSKPKKAGAKKRKSDKTQQSQADATMKTETQKLRKIFSIPVSVLDFQTVTKALTLLHEPKVTWATTTDANLIKPKIEFHQHIMQTTLHLVQNVKRRRDIETKVKKLYFDHISGIAAILFNRIIKRLNEFIDFDSVTAMLAMECFNVILVVVNAQYRSNMKEFLSRIVSNDNDDGTFISQLMEIITVYQKLFELDENETGDDTEMKKISLIVINTLTTLSGFFPGMVNSSSVQMSEWLKNVAYHNNVTAKVSSAFSNLFFETHVKCRVSLNLLEVISVSIGETMGVLIEEEDHKPETFKIINEATAHNMLLSLCGTVKSVLEDIEALINRLKSEHHLLMYHGVENLDKKKENLKNKERGVCCQLCFIVNIMTNVVNLLVPTGNMTEAIFKNIMHLFSTLSSLTKHFIMRSSKINLAFQGARFERVVKLVGKQLSPAIYKFILHMEDSEKEATQATQNKKKSIDANTMKSKVLRETRLIPKVIYEIEQFSKCVIQLSNKTKVDLNKYVGQGIVRDFRITELKQVLEKEGVADEDATQSTEADRSVATEEESDEEVEEEEEDRSPAKKRKII